VSPLTLKPTLEFAVAGQADPPDRPFGAAGGSNPRLPSWAMMSRSLWTTPEPASMLGKLLPEHSALTVAAGSPDLLGDRYQLEAELGTGGQGTVYRALDRHLGRTVAVKVLHPELSPLLGSERFQREIAIAASLSHPNIVPLLDSGGQGARLWYTMPLAEGETLRARLRRQTQLRLDEALAITRDVAAAIDYAHGRGIIHRDIKPENIVFASGHASVLDFGLARAIEVAGEEAITSGNLVMGTPAYMSPEQASGQTRLDGAADIYSLGCVLYEMLAGAPPFSGATAHAIIARHLIDAPPSISVVRPAVSRGLEEALGKALAKVPADRYRSGAEMVRALETAEPAGRARGWGLRTQLTVAAAVAAVAVGTLMARPTVSLDSNKVMGFPLLARGGVPAFEVEQVEEAVAAAMQDTDPLRWLRARLFLGGDARGNLTADSATRVARKRGARYWLGGSLARIADSTIVRLELYDAQADSLVASRAEVGPPGTPAYVLAFRAVNLLLPKVVGRSTHVAEKYLERHRPAAVAKWLAGEVAYRNARYQDALALYREALAADSTLVPAALKGAMSASWLVQYPTADSLVQLALRHESELPQANRLLAHGMAHQLAGDGDSAAIWYRRAVEQNPDWSEAWYSVGEAAYHLWPAGDDLDSVANDAFLRSVQTDPDFAPVVFHLAELAIARNDLDQAGSLVTRYRRLSADTAQQLQLELMLECVRSPGSADWSPLARRDTAGVALIDAGRILAAGGRHLGCAASAYGAALRSGLPDESQARRWTASVGLHHIALARGDRGAAKALADSIVAAGQPAGRGLRILEALLGAGPDSIGAAEMAAQDAPLDSVSVARLQWFGEWSAVHGDTARLAAVTEQMRRDAAISGLRADSVRLQAVEARLLLARGDTAAAIDRLRALHPVAPLDLLLWGHWESMSAERLLLARLLLARGRPAEAMGVATTFDAARSGTDLAYLPLSLDLRRQAAARLGAEAQLVALARRQADLSRR
jgi:serine/threonine-protein kinase